MAKYNIESEERCTMINLPEPFGVIELTEVKGVCSAVIELSDEEAQTLRGIGKQAGFKVSKTK